MKYFFPIYIFCACLCLQCTSPVKKSEKLLQIFIDTHEQKIAEMERDLSLNQWQLLIESNSQNAQRAMQGSLNYMQTTNSQDSIKTEEFYHIQLDKLYSNQDDLHFLTRLQECNHISDPLLQKQLIILIDKYRQRQLSPDVYKKHLQMYMKVAKAFSQPEQTDSLQSYRSILHVLGTCTNSQRLEKYWHLSEEIAQEVAAPSITNVKALNKIAVEYSNGQFTNYFDYDHAMRGIDVQWFDSLRTYLEQQTRSIYFAHKNKVDQNICRQMHIRSDEIRPWHYGKYFSSSYPSILVQPLETLLLKKDIQTPVLQYFQDTNLQIDELLAHSNLVSRPNMDPRSFIMVIDPRINDIRVNAHLGDGLYSLRALLYVLSGAASYKYVDEDIPYFVHVQHSIMMHTGSNYFARNAFQPDWLQQYLQIDLDAQQRYMINDIYKSVLVFRLRRNLLLSQFIQLMYYYPNQDLNLLWQNLTDKYLGISYPEGSEIPWWACIMNVAQASMRHPSFIVALVAESQISHYFGEDASPAQIGEFFKTFYHDGISTPWQQTMQNTLGEKLNAAYFLQDIQ